MRTAILAALACLCVSSVAQDEFLKGDALQAEIAKSCGDGCLTFNREEAQTFVENLEMLIAQKQQEAFAAGVKHQQAACASLI